MNTTRTVAIVFDGYHYYHSFVGEGLRSKKSYKTEGMARRVARAKGHFVIPAPVEYRLPLYLDPTSETYKSA